MVFLKKEKLQGKNGNKTKNNGGGSLSRIKSKSLLVSSRKLCTLTLQSRNPSRALWCTSTDSALGEERQANVSGRPTWSTEQVSAQPEILKRNPCLEQENQHKVETHLTQSTENTDGEGGLGSHTMSLVSSEPIKKMLHFL